jgi:Tol biopolymer transport system component
MKTVIKISVLMVLLLSFYACDSDMGDGAVIIIALGYGIAGPDWGLNGRIVFTASTNETISSEIWYCEADGAGLTRVTSNDYIDEYRPSWSPDGTKVVCETFNEVTSERGLSICSVAGGTLTPLLTGDYYQYPKWSPDGSWIAYGYDGNVYIIDPEGGEPEQLTSAGGAWPVGWSESGNKLIYVQWKGGLYGLISRDLTTGVMDELYWFDEPPNTLNEMDISPDGEWVAYDYEDQERWVTDIYIVDLKTGKKRKITAEKPFEGEVIPGLPAGAFEPTVSPDGAWVAFTSNRSGAYVLHKIRVFE